MTPKMMLFKIPPKRLPMFRKSATLLKELCERGNVKLKLQDDGVLAIEGDGGNEWITQQVLSALTLGFKPNQAFKLFGDDYFLEQIDLDLSCRGSEKQIARAKARIIGTEGKAMKRIEELTDAHLAVNDNTVALLGKFEDLKLAKEAVFRVLEGAEHSNVYVYLEKMKARQQG